MTPQELLARIVALFPNFAAHWDDPNTYSCDEDGAFTLHRVFSELTNFFRDHHQSLPPDRVAALGAFVSECMDSADEDLDNAAATCFVENIAGEGYDRELARNLTGEARKFWQSWQAWGAAPNLPCGQSETLSGGDQP